jgi:hypothetical protein
MSTAPSLQAAQLAASYDQYRRSRVNHSQVRLTSEERMMVSRHVWNDSSQRGTTTDKETVFPDSAGNGLRIECVPTEPRNTLADRMEVSRRRQAEDDRQLASTFCHDGSMFLVFKKRET